MFAVLLILALSALNKEVIANPGIKDGSFILDYPIEVIDDYSAKPKRDECSERLNVDEPSKRTEQESTKNLWYLNQNKCPDECYIDTVKKVNEKKSKIPLLSTATQLQLACKRLFNMNIKESQAYYQI